MYQVIKHKQAIISDWVVSIIFFLYTSLIYYASIYHKYYVIDDNFRGISVWPVAGWNATPLVSGRSQKVVALGLGCLFLVVEGISVN
jgi:hypothetical protein